MQVEKMRVIPEPTLLDLLGRCVSLSGEVLPLLAARGTAPAAQPLVKRYSAILDEIHRHKRHESVLADESWEWIWEVRPGLNHLQLYGRLAWLNYNLFDLL